MSNLDNLTQKILEDAKNKADIIMEESTKRNDGIVSSRVKEATERQKKIIEKATIEANMMKDRVISNAELRVRDEKLKAKQQLIDKVFDKSKERLNNINEDDYLKFLSSNIKAIKFNGTEEIIVPERMKAKVKALGLNPKVSNDETVDSGFIIKDNDVMLNYTFDSLIDYLREELESEIAKDLFKG